MLTVLLCLVLLTIVGVAGTVLAVNRDARGRARTVEIYDTRHPHM